VGYLTDSEVKDLGLAHVGELVLISDRAVIQNANLVSIGDRSRIDDFSIVSGMVTIGKNVHIAVYAHLSGGETGIDLRDFSGVAFGGQIFAESDDYSGNSLTNPTVAREFKTPVCGTVIINRHVIIGAHTVIMPGVEIGEGTAVGSLSLVNRSIDSWGIFSGIPVKRLKNRSKKLLELEREYLFDLNQK